MEKPIIIIIIIIQFPSQQYENGRLGFFRWIIHHPIPLNLNLGPSPFPTLNHPNIRSVTHPPFHPKAVEYDLTKNGRNMVTLSIFSIPIGSMYGLFTYTFTIKKKTKCRSKYTISHGWYGIFTRTQPTKMWQNSPSCAQLESLSIPDDVPI